MCQSVQSKISLIRKELEDKGLDAYIIPSSDPHQSEYLPSHWQVRKWVSGFTGSAGSAMISGTAAGLWTDSRYWLQAEKELRDTPFDLHRAGQKDVLLLEDYLLTHLEEGSVVGINPFATSVNVSRKLEEKLAAKNITVNASHQIGLDTWDACGRQPPILQQIYYHGDEYIDRAIEEKLDLVRAEMRKSDAAAHLITTLDDIAWLFNLRGSDISNNPVFLSYALIYDSHAVLYCSVNQLDATVKSILSEAGVSCAPYDQVSKDLGRLTSRVLIDPDQCSVGLYDQIAADLVVNAVTPSRKIKARKTSSQIAHIEDAMVKDGIALAHAFHYLYQHLGEIREHELAQKISSSRSEQAGYKGESFPAIVGYQSNGAIVHYRPGPDSAIIHPEGLLLCDSGGQYINGTTDITRTMAVGPTSEEQKEMYTRVLKGHIAVDQAIFPKGKVGRDLDVFARQYLWQAGQDFGHGTGHGVGYFLNVHEPPQSISPGKSERANVAFQPGMLTSNEPGFYKDGAYGIRIENLIVCEETEQEGYLKHRHLTLFPIDTSIIQKHLLTRDEVMWINDYHLSCASLLLPHLDGEVKEFVQQLCVGI